MVGITPKLDAQLALLRYAEDVASRAEADEKIPGYPVEAVEHVRYVAFYLRMAAAYVETLPDIVEADGDEPSLPEEPETST